MSYGSTSREQQLEAALQALLDLFDEEVLIINPQDTDSERAKVEDAVDAAGMALMLDDEYTQDQEVE